LRAVLVLARAFDNELDTVVGSVGLEGRWDAPAVRASIGDIVHNCLDGDNICGGTTEEKEGNVACQYRVSQSLESFTRESWAHLE
jgi:hypothetical protein